MLMPVGRIVEVSPGCQPMFGFPVLSGSITIGRIHGYAVDDDGVLRDPAVIPNLHPAFNGIEGFINCLPRDGDPSRQ